MMTEDLDAVVIGAGFAGLAALHLLRERGLRVRAYDDAGNVGGTWWWHAYPGAHLDTECHVYQYWFSETLYRDWGWSERYPAGYEVQRWLRFVADRLDLRRDIRSSTRVVSLRSGDGWWTVRTDRGETVRARHVIACTGRRSVEPEVDASGFAGLVVRTAAWPEDGHDLTGRRVGILGTTAATVQLVPWIADRVAGLVVVDSGALDVVRRVNPLFGWQEREAYKARFAELPGEVVEPAPDRAAMRARTGDARLIPDGPPGRVLLDDGYLEAFDREHIALLARADVACVAAEGLGLTDGRVVRLDVLVVPDDFDAGPPAAAGLVETDAPGLHDVVAPCTGTPAVDLQRRLAAVVEQVAVTDRRRADELEAARGGGEA
jgi:NADPH-dependent 2,4-dienoyl-CoA reductase/sulfur reductase-like enzyme